MISPTLLVNVSTGQANTALLRVASSLSERLGAGVIGVAARQPMQFNLSGMCYVAPEIFTEERAETEAEMDRAQAEFRAAFPGHGVEWRSSVSFGMPYEYIAAQARHADLVVTGVPDDKGGTTRATAGELVMQCGRPVLVVPATATQSLDRVMLAWKDTREARRAAIDALPLLRQARSVAIVEIADASEIPAAQGRVHDVSRWLDRHGVVAETMTVVAQREDASQLASLAHETGADLIVAGAYGHSRLREWAFGGVTHTLLHHGLRCALLSH